MAFQGARSAQNDWDILSTASKSTAASWEAGDAPNIPRLTAVIEAERLRREAAGRRAAKRRQAGRPSKFKIGGQTDEQFLESAHTWIQPVGTDWHPVKVLGRGGYGVAGLWEYRGRSRRRVRRVVVKQSSHVSSLEEEARILRMINRGRPPHALKIYRDIFYDYVDGLGSVGRIYLEFMEGGDLFQYADKTALMDDKIPEVNAWAIFHCMALGLCIMANGSEDPDAPPRDGPMITHFDIKPENFLRGKIDEHHMVDRMVKFADFGLAREMPLEQIYDETNAREAVDPEIRGLGTFNYGPPEADRYPIKGRYIGTCTNIWGVGVTMVDVLTAKFEKFRGGDPWHSELTPEGLIKGGTTLINTKYSNELKRLIWRCCKVDPPQRPGANELQRLTKRGLENALRDHPSFPQEVTDGTNQVPPALDWSSDEESAEIPQQYRVPTPEEATPVATAAATSAMRIIRRGVKGLDSLKKPLAKAADRAQELHARRMARKEITKQRMRSEAEAKLRRYQKELEQNWDARRQGDLDNAGFTVGKRQVVGFIAQEEEASQANVRDLGDTFISNASGGPGARDGMVLDVDEPAVDEPDWNSHEG